jgi:MSHA biogenesis protein MshM
MYLQFFGLNDYPFKLTPDTALFYAYPKHQEALNTLIVALLSGEGFLKVTGEVGTGKTLLCRKLLSLLDDNFHTAWLPNPQYDAAGLRRAVAEELGVTTLGLDDHQLHRCMNERLMALHAQGKRVVLVVDEAQSMSEESLEALRLLTNLETEKNKLLQVVLFGQPELDVILARPGIRQLRQRITFACHITPMDRVSVQDYVMYRLRGAGYNGPALFDSRANQLLAKASRGVPRMINILAHKSLMSAYGRGERLVTKGHVERAILDTRDGYGLERIKPKSFLQRLFGR